MRMVIYCDMDGVLADFNSEPKAVERFKTEKGFFKNLKPMKENIKGLRMLKRQGFEIKILSTSPHDNADKDKKAWLKKYVKFVKKSNIIMARPEIAKIDYLKENERKLAILIDDYGKNIKEWLAGGGLTAVKITPEPKTAEIDYLNIQYFARVLDFI